MDEMMEKKNIKKERKQEKIIKAQKKYKWKKTPHAHKISVNNI